MLKKQLHALDQLIPALVQASQPGPSNDTRREALLVLKRLGKQQALSMNHLEAIVPSVMSCVRDRTIPIKLAAERCLVHVLRIKQGHQFLDKYLERLDNAQASNIGDYAKRVLVKLSSRDSDSEEE